MSKKEFIFTQERRYSNLYRNKFVVHAETYEDALKIVEEINEDDKNLITQPNVGMVETQHVPFTAIKDDSEPVRYFNKDGEELKLNVYYNHNNKRYRVPRKYDGYE